MTSYIGSMMNLLKIELIKSLNSRSVRIFLLIYILFIPLLISSIGNGAINLGGMRKNLSDYFQFPHVWSYVAYIAGFFHILLGFIIINAISNEYSFGTLKQQVMDGVSRKDVLFAKIGLMKFLAFIGMVLLIVCSLIFGWMYSETKEGIFSQWHIPLFFFLQAMGYMCLAALIVFLMKRGGISYFLFLIFWLIEKIIGNYIKPIKDYLPLEAFASLIPRPFANQAKGIGIDLSQLPVSIALGLSIFYICLFCGLIFLLLKNRDL